MKTLLIIPLLCLASMAGYAQHKYTTNDNPPLKKGERIAVTPAFSEPFTVMSEPACYMYKRNSGLVVLECPGILFAPPAAVAATLARTETARPDQVTVQRTNTYTGNYPEHYVPKVAIPANAVPVYPTTPYIMLQDPPCYKYVNKRGLEVMECPGLRLPPANQ